MGNPEPIATQFAYRRPFVTPLMRLGHAPAAVAVLLDTLVARLTGGGLFNHEEWQAKLAQIWQRDFAEVAVELWERLGAADEGHLCQRECGARCCQSACLVLNPQEAAVLRRRGRELGREVSILDQGGLVELGGGDPMEGRRWMLPAYPCPFLSSDKLCRVYPNRPLHCQLHPSYWREECPLSHRWYFRETSIPRQPLEEAPAEVLERLAELTRPRYGRDEPGSASPRA